jgi:hypothetical protein
MSDTKRKILHAILNAVDEVNEQLPADRRIPRDVATALVGFDGCLDSLALVNLILAAEQKITETLGVLVILTDQEDLFEPGGPCSSVERLTNHVASMIERGSNA